MELKLNFYFSPLADTNDFDARALASALTRLSYHKPDPHTGIVPFDPHHKFFDDIRRFQNDHKLFPDGALRPGGKTETAINAALKRLEASGQYYVWRTVRDGKARSAHAAQEGRVYRQNEKPGSIDPAKPGAFHPGDDYNCRCWPEPLYAGYKPPPLPERKPNISAQLQAENLYPDAINPVYSLDALLGLGSGIILKSGIKLTINTLRVLRDITRRKSETDNNLTDHGSMRLKQRNISNLEKDEAIKTAKLSGRYKTKIGKYGTPQTHYEGENGITVIVETSGRNSGKVITSWRRQETQMRISSKEIDLILQAEDIEGLIESGAPSDEYHSEVQDIIQALEKLNSSEFTQENILAIVSAIWLRNFNLQEEELKKRESALIRITRKISQ